MSVEFIDANVLIYANDGGAGALSIQVLSEFYSTATRKLSATSAEAEAVMRDLGDWTIHRPAHADLLKAAQLHRRYKLAWWDALILTSAIELGCSVLWTEDFSDGQRLGQVTIRNPFR